MGVSARVAVAGGSLGGLTAALVLRDLGLDVTVFERSAVELEQRGAGIGFLPASYRYLIERGGFSLDDISVETGHIRYLDRRGAVVHDAVHSYRFSSWNTVYRALLGLFGRDRYLLGSEVEQFETDLGGVELKVSGRVDRFDLLVCADGSTSRARRVLQPTVGPQYSGYVAWRGTVPEGDLDDGVVAQIGDAITYFVYANSHILVYPIPGADGSVAEGRRLINFVWYRNYQVGGDLDEVLTDTDGERRDISLPPGSARAVHIAELKATAAARLPTVLAEVVEGVEKPFVQVVFDLEPQWMHFGRVCLLGDAAWVVRPHAAAGTAKAAADAWALAEALETYGEVGPALAAWEPAQMELGRRLAERTRSIGRRSQFDGDWDPRDPQLIFGLYGPGE